MKTNPRLFVVLLLLLGVLTVILFTRSQTTRTDERSGQSADVQGGNPPAATPSSAQAGSSVNAQNPSIPGTMPPQSAAAGPGTAAPAASLASGEVVGRTNPNPAAPGARLVKSEAGEPFLEHRPDFKYPLVRVEPVTHIYSDGSVYTKNVEMVADHVMVRMESGADLPAIESALQAMGASVRSRRSAPRMILVAFDGSDPARFDKTIEAIEKIPGVAKSEPDYIVRAGATPNDEFYNLCWGQHNTGQRITLAGRFDFPGGTPDADIDAPEAWNGSTSATAITVAVIDTGVDWDHPDLADNIWTNPGEIAGNGIDDDANGFVDDVRGWDFQNDDNDPDDDHYHGTHCAGTIGARGNNGIGVAGVAWQAKIIPVKFLGKSGGATSDAIDAVYYAAEIGASVASNSWGGPGYSELLEDAFDYAATKNQLCIVAAANDSSDNDLVPVYPASFESPSIVTVAATDQLDGLASFSNYGIETVDIGAPGFYIFSTVPIGNQNGYGLLSGTSMATPHVAGAAALLYSALGPEAPYSLVQNALLTSGDTIPSLVGKTKFGRRLNLQKLMASLSSGLFQGMLSADVDDDNIGGTSGNDNGIPGEGESVALDLSLFNSGNSSTAPLTATLSVVSDPNGVITVTDATANLSPVAAHQLGTFDDAVAFTIVNPAPAANCPVTLRVTVSDGVTSITRDLDFTVHQEALISGRVRLNGTGVEAARVRLTGATSYTVTTDATGNYSLRVPRGTYDVQTTLPTPYATMNGVPRYDAFNYWLTDSVQTLSITADLTKNFSFTSHSLTGTVRGADNNQVISNVAVSLLLSYDWVPAIKYRTYLASTTASGTYAITYVIPDGETNYTLELYVSHPDYDGAYRSITKGTPKVADFLLQSTRMLVEPREITLTLPTGTSRSIDASVSNVGTAEGVWRAVTNLNYTMSSSRSGGPAYSWTDISGNPSAVAFTGWSLSAEKTVPIGFPMKFYDAVSDQAILSEMGSVLSFTSSSIFVGHYLSAMPNTSMPHNAIIARRGASGVNSGYNLNVGTVHYLHLDDDGDGQTDHFVLQCKDLREDKYNISGQGSGVYLYTRQVHLFRDGSFHIDYNTIPSSNFLFTAGIQDAMGYIGVNIDKRDYEVSPVMLSNTRISFAPRPSWLSVLNEAGSLPGGKGSVVPLLFDANGLDVGSYETELVIHDLTNEVLKKQTVIPIRLNVVYDPNLPVADAGRTQSVNAGDTVTLDGSDSYAPGGSPLTYQWEFLSGPKTITLANPNEAQSTFVAAIDDFDDLGDYLFRLTVSDGSHSASSDVKVTVNAFNVAFLKSVTINRYDTTYGAQHIPAALTDGVYLYSTTTRALYPLIGSANPDGYTQFEIDLVGTYEVNELRLWGSSGTSWMPKNYTMYGWNGLEWISIGSVGATPTSQVQKFTVPAGSAFSKIRFNGTSSHF